MSLKKSKNSFHRSRENLVPDEKLSDDDLVTSGEIGASGNIQNPNIEKNSNLVQLSQLLHDTLVNVESLELLLVPPQGSTLRRIFASKDSNAHDVNNESTMDEISSANKSLQSSKKPKRLRSRYPRKTFYVHDRTKSNNGNLDSCGDLSLAEAISSNSKTRLDASLRRREQQKKNKREDESRRKKTRSRSEESTLSLLKHTEEATDDEKDEAENATERDTFDETITTFGETKNSVAALLDEDVLESLYTDYFRYFQAARTEGIAEAYIHSIIYTLINLSKALLGSKSVQAEASVLESISNNASMVGTMLTDIKELLDPAKIQAALSNSFDNRSSADKMAESYNKSNRSLSLNNPHNVGNLHSADCDSPRKFERTTAFVNISEQLAESNSKISVEMSTAKSPKTVPKPKPKVKAVELLDYDNSCASAVGCVRSRLLEEHLRQYQLSMRKKSNGKGEEKRFYSPWFTRKRELTVIHNMLGESTTCPPHPGYKTDIGNLSELESTGRGRHPASTAAEITTTTSSGSQSKSKNSKMAETATTTHQSNSPTSDSLSNKSERVVRQHQGKGKSVSSSGTFANNSQNSILNCGNGSASGSQNGVSTRRNPAALNSGGEDKNGSMNSNSGSMSNEKKKQRQLLHNSANDYTLPVSFSNAAAKTSVPNTPNKAQLNDTDIALQAEGEARAPLTTDEKNGKEEKRKSIADSESGGNFVSVPRALRADSAASFPSEGRLQGSFAECSSGVLASEEDNGVRYGQQLDSGYSTFTSKKSDLKSTSLNNQMAAERSGTKDYRENEQHGDSDESDYDDDSGSHTSVILGEGEGESLEYDFIKHNKNKVYRNNVNRNPTNDYNYGYGRFMNKKYYVNYEKGITVEELEAGGTTTDTGTNSHNNTNNTNRNHRQSFNSGNDVERSHAGEDGSVTNDSFQANTNSFGSSPNYPDNSNPLESCVRQDSRSKTQTRTSSNSPNSTPIGLRKTSGNGTNSSFRDIPPLAPTPHPSFGSLRSNRTNSTTFLRRGKTEGSINDSSDTGENGEAFVTPSLPHYYNNQDNTLPSVGSSESSDRISTKNSNDAGIGAGIVKPKEATSVNSTQEPNINATESRAEDKDAVPESQNGKKGAPEVPGNESEPRSTGETTISNGTNTTNCGSKSLSELLDETQAPQGVLLTELRDMMSMNKSSSTASLEKNKKASKSSSENNQDAKTRSDNDVKEAIQHPFTIASTLPKVLGSTDKETVKVEPVEGNMNVGTKTGGNIPHDVKAKLGKDTVNAVELSVESGVVCAAAEPYQKAVGRGEAPATETAMKAVSNIAGQHDSTLNTPSVKNSTEIHPINRRNSDYDPPILSFTSKGQEVALHASKKSVDFECTDNEESSLKESMNDEGSGASLLYNKRQNTLSYITDKDGARKHSNSLLGESHDSSVSEQISSSKAYRSTGAVHKDIVNTEEKIDSETAAESNVAKRIQEGASDKLPLDEATNINKELIENQDIKGDQLIMKKDEVASEQGNAGKTKGNNFSQEQNILSTLMSRNISEKQMRREFDMESPLSILSGLDSVEPGRKQLLLNNVRFDPTSSSSSTPVGNSDYTGNPLYSGSSKSNSAPSTALDAGRCEEQTKRILSESASAEEKDFRRFGCSRGSFYTSSPMKKNVHEVNLKSPLDKTFDELYFNNYATCASSVYSSSLKEKNNQPHGESVREVDSSSQSSHSAPQLGVRDRLRSKVPLLDSICSGSSGHNYTTNTDTLDSGESREREKIKNKLLSPVIRQHTFPLSTFSGYIDDPLSKKERQSSSKTLLSDNLTGVGSSDDSCLNTGLVSAMTYVQEPDLGSSGGLRRLDSVHSTPRSVKEKASAVQCKLPLINQTSQTLPPSLGQATTDPFGGVRKGSTATVLNLNEVSISDQVGDSAFQSSPTSFNAEMSKKRKESVSSSAVHKRGSDAGVKSAEGKRKKESHFRKMHPRLSTEDGGDGSSSSSRSCSEAADVRKYPARSITDYAVTLNSLNVSTASRISTAGTDSRADLHCSRRNAPRISNDGSENDLVSNALPEHPNVLNLYKIGETAYSNILMPSDKRRKKERGNESAGDESKDDSSTFDSTRVSLSTGGGAYGSESSNLLSSHGGDLDERIGIASKTSSGDEKVVHSERRKASGKSEPSKVDAADSTSKPSQLVPNSEVVDENDTSKMDNNLSVGSQDTRLPQLKTRELLDLATFDSYSPRVTTASGGASLRSDAGLPLPHNTVNADSLTFSPPAALNHNSTSTLKFTRGQTSNPNQTGTISCSSPTSQHNTPRVSVTGSGAKSTHVVVPDSTQNLSKEKQSVIRRFQRLSGEQDPLLLLYGDSGSAEISDESVYNNTMRSSEFNRTNMTMDVSVSMPSMWNNTFRSVSGRNLLGRNLYGNLASGSGTRSVPTDHDHSYDSRKNYVDSNEPGTLPQNCSRDSEPNSHAPHQVGEDSPSSNDALDPNAMLLEMQLRGRSNTVAPNQLPSTNTPTATGRISIASRLASAQQRYNPQNTHVRHGSASLTDSGESISISSASPTTYNSSSYPLQLARGNTSRASLETKDSGSTKDSKPTYNSISPNSTTLNSADRNPSSGSSMIGGSAAVSPRLPVGYQYYRGMRDSGLRPTLDASLPSKKSSYF